MKRLPLTLLHLFVFFQLVLGLSPTYISCQLQKSAGESPLEGCPEGTLYVSPTDPRANFSSVQEAIDSLKTLSPGPHPDVILIGAGNYSEMLNVTQQKPLRLIGELYLATASGDASQRNLVHIWNNLYSGENGKLTDEETATLTIAPSYGHSFGNVDFRAYNINFENRAANTPTSPALAISTTLTNASFYGCVFKSRQDTFYTGEGASTFVADSVISGETDYVFGCGTSFLHSVTLASLGCGGGITAWQGTPGTNRGVYISNSSIIRSPDADPAVVMTKRCFLGRPWNGDSVTVLLHNYMDDIIHPAGFTPWDGDTTVPTTTFYAEFDSHGPGGNTSARVSQDHILKLEQAQKFGLEYVFHEKPRWIDAEYHY